MPAKDDKKHNEPKLSDWMKVMLGEIERKRSEQEEAQRELERREGNRDKDDAPTDNNA
ncbi:MAG TPA: hypothetical protein VIN61_00290 [Gammaproteobacteria bacterium]